MTDKAHIVDILDTTYEADYAPIPTVAEDEAEYLGAGEMKKTIKRLRKEMFDAAAALDFERAAQLRDRMLAMEEKLPDATFIADAKE